MAEAIAAKPLASRKAMPCRWPSSVSPSSSSGTLPPSR